VYQSAKGSMWVLHNLFQMVIVATQSRIIVRTFRTVAMRRRAAH
jgi:hypothetical protein